MSHTTIGRIPFDHQADPARFLSEAMVREVTEQVEARTWRRDDTTQTLRPTFVGAWNMTWRLLPPFRAIRLARLRRRAAALLRELDMEGRDPHPVAQPRSRMSVAWIVALAVAILIVTRWGTDAVRGLGTLTRGRTVQLPTGFVVPDDFSAAVRALERLAARPRRRSPAPIHSATRR